MDPAAFARSTVLVRWAYVTPAQARLKIRAMQKICREGPFLDCVLEYAEVSKVTTAFAEAHGVPELADPELFLDALDEMDLVLAEDAADAV